MSNALYRTKACSGIETAQAMMIQVGELAGLRMDGLIINVKIIDARQRWGQLDYLVAPIAGKGERWVAASKIGGVA